MTKEKTGGRERLIVAGIRRIGARGISDFSLRAVAADCGLSCAAPYRHFKNKNELLLAILSYIHDAWHRVQTEIIMEREEDLRGVLTKISMAYIRFLVENPSFRAIIMVPDIALNAEHREMILRLSERTVELIREYARREGLTEEAVYRKTSAIRALIYGYALMLSSGEVAPDEAGYAMIESVVSREFDLV